MKETFLIDYHIGEELLIGLLCLAVAWRARKASGEALTGVDVETRSRIFLLGSGFFVLGISSSIHAVIHAAQLNPDLLYQTLLATVSAFLF